MRNHVGRQPGELRATGHRRIRGTIGDVKPESQAVLSDYRWLLNQFRATSPGAITRAIAEVIRFDSTGWIGDVDVPSSIVVNLRDRALPTQGQHWLASQIPGAHTVTVDAGHAGYTFRTDRFVPALGEAIGSVHRRITVDQHKGA